MIFDIIYYYNINSNFSEEQDEFMDYYLSFPRRLDYIYSGIFATSYILYFNIINIINYYELIPAFLLLFISLLTYVTTKNLKKQFFKDIIFTFFTLLFITILNFNLFNKIFYFTILYYISELLFHIPQLLYNKVMRTQYFMLVLINIIPLMYSKYYYNHSDNYIENFKYFLFCNSFVFVCACIIFLIMFLENIPAKIETLCNLVKRNYNGNININNNLTNNSDYSYDNNNDNNSESDSDSDSDNNNNYNSKIKKNLIDNIKIYLNNNNNNNNNKEFILDIEDKEYINEIKDIINLDNINIELLEKNINNINKKIKCPLCNAKNSKFVQVKKTNNICIICATKNTDILYLKCNHCITCIECNFNLIKY